jgi:serine/threonine protein kinase
MQLNINDPGDIVFEWIPFNQFINIKEIGKGGFATVYSAIWKNGPLYYDNSKYEYTWNNWYKEVALKCLNNSQNISSEFLNEV